MARYGTTFHVQGSPDHMVSGGLLISDQFAIDVSATREAAFGSAAWRPSVSLALRVGRYTIAAARGSGINDIGGTYRVGIDIEIG